jgi:SAM-dependent methyltransferase
MPANGTNSKAGPSPVLGRLTRWLQANVLWRRDTARGFDPHAYWCNRHLERRGSLKAVGHIELDERQNAEEYDIRRHHIRRTLETLPDAPTRAIELGCGVGQMLLLLHDLGWEVTGVDISPIAIEQARTLIPRGNFHVADLSVVATLERFDLVAWFDVLFHVVDDSKWEQCVRRATGLLNQGGRLLLLEHLVDESMYQGQRGHVHFRPRTAYDRLFEQTGLRLEHHGRFYLPHSKVHKDILLLKKSAPGE